MKVREVLEEIDRIAPFALAEEWDNIGLMVGDPAQEVRRLGVALDPLPEAVERAAEAGCQALLTHHPLFFSPVKKLDFSTTVGWTVCLAARLNVAILAAHTNWDCAEGGVSFELARLLGLRGVFVLDPDSGLGAVGDFAERLPSGEVLDRIKRTWGLTWVDGYIAQDCSILRVALCGGSGSSLWPQAQMAGAELYVTADVKYHTLLDAERAGMPIAVVDHAEMERASLEELARCLSIPGELETVLIGIGGLASPQRL